jgi:cysteine desulfurase
VNHEIYFDNNATTRPLPEVLDAILQALDGQFGNPSSAHSAGDRARRLIASARESVAALIGVDPANILFTSGATESNNLVIRSSTEAYGGRCRARVLITAVEHSSVLKICEHQRLAGFEVAVLPVNHRGQIDLAEFEQSLSPSTALVSVQWANNETGVIQPVAEIGRICESHGIPFHTDAAQAIGKMEMNLSTIPSDFVSLTAHKIHGPAGIGALYIRNRNALTPMLLGGPQEVGLRAGTENLAGIAGFGRAAKLRLTRFTAVNERLAGLRNRFEELVLQSIPDVTVNGAGADRLSNSTNLRFAGVDGQALVSRLDQSGIMCSQSSACTNQRPEPSYVLRAMGLSEADAYSSVRFSFSELNTVAEIETAIPVIADLCRDLRAFRARRRNPYLRPVEVH